MLPDERVGCHRTGFAMTCHDGVTKHKCSLWCHLDGLDAQGNHVDVFGCADTLEIKFLHEIAKEVRHATASTDKVANEVRRASDGAAIRDVHLINGLKATVPVMQIADALRGQIEKSMIEDQSDGERT